MDTPTVLSNEYSVNIPTILLNEHFDDRYFDVVNAIDEAQKIYFDYNQLTSRLLEKRCEDAVFLIGETGFGAGRILVALLEYIKLNNLKNISIEYNSVELYPITAERMSNILEAFRDRVGEEINMATTAYQDIDINEKGWHTTTISNTFGMITLKLFIGEALDMVQDLEKPCDVWFLDGHGPKKNPSIWRSELLFAIGEKTKQKGTCSTFTVSGIVKTALRSAGFELQKLPGCGGKKHVLFGIKNA